MQTISADEILAAIKGRGIEAIGDDGVIVLSLAGTPFLTISEAPIPEVQKGPDNSITVMSGDVGILHVACDSEEDAADIAGALAELLLVD